MKSSIWFSNDFQLRVWKWVLIMVRLASQRTSAVVVIIFNMYCTVPFSSVTQSCTTLWDPMNRSKPGLPVHHQLSEPTQTPSSRWCHPIISSSVIPFSSCPQSFPTSGSFQMSQLFSSGGQNIGVSASTSVLPMNTQDWSPLGWTGWISLQSKGLSSLFQTLC